MIEEQAAELYRALGRPPPQVLATDDPLTFVRYVRAVARPGSLQLVIGGCIVAMLAMAAPMLWPAPRASPAPVAAVAGLAWFLVTLVGLEGVGRPGLPLRVRLLPPVLLAILCMGTGMAAFGTPMAAAQGAALVVILYGVRIASGLVVGDLVGRLTLRRRGLAIPLLGSPVIGRSLVARLATALDDPEAERHRVELLPALPPEERAAAAKLDAVLDRLPFWLERHELRPLLGRTVPDWRQSALRRGRDLADPPRLVAAALALDREAIATTLFADAVVALVGTEAGHETDAVAVAIEELGLGADWRLLLRLIGSWRVRVLALLLDREPNPILRIDAVQRLGEQLVVTALGRRPFAADQAGELYRIGPERQPTLLVKVRDPTPSPDGALRHQCLSVPPHVATALEAVAWTFGAGERQYRPGVETWRRPGGWPRLQG